MAKKKPKLYRTQTVRGTAYSWSKPAGVSTELTFENYKIVEKVVENSVQSKQRSR